MAAKVTWRKREIVRGILGESGQWMTAHELAAAARDVSMRPPPMRDLMGAAGALRDEGLAEESWRHEGRKRMKQFRAVQAA